MASGDSRRLSKGKKLSPSVSSNDEEHQWISLNEWAAMNDIKVEDNSIKPGSNSNSQAFHNVRYPYPLAEDIVHEENSKRQTEEVFPDDLVMSVPASNEFASSQTMYPEFFENPQDAVHDHIAVPVDLLHVRPQSSIRTAGSQAIHTDFFDRPLSPNRAKSPPHGPKSPYGPLVKHRSLSPHGPQSPYGPLVKKPRSPSPHLHISEIKNITAVKEEYKKNSALFDSSNKSHPAVNVLAETERRLTQCPISRRARGVRNDEVNSKLLNERTQAEEKVISNVGERETHKNIGRKLTSFELARKKLKNKLVELEDKKLLNEDLISKLVIEPEDSYSAEENVASVMSSQRGLRCERPNIPSRSQRMDSRKRNTRTVSNPTKRDNVRKEINSFPARRHYEAEGRANEDTIAPNPGTLANSRTSSKKDGLQLSRDTINKIRKIQKCPDLMDECSELLYAYLEQEKTGMKYSEKNLNTHLDELLNLSDNEMSGEIFDDFPEKESNDDERHDEDDLDSPREEQEVIATSPSDVKCDEQHNPEAINMYERVDQMGHALRKNELLLHNLYKHLMDKQDKPGRLGSFLNQISSQSLSSELEDSNRNRQNYHDNVIRSSGEGSFANRNGHIQPDPTIYRHPNSISSSDNVQSSQVFKRNLSSAPCSSLDNIQSHSVNRNSNSSSSDGIQSNYFQNISRSESKQLTRPNAVSIEYQIQSLNRNLHKAPSTRKKDNNLSDKIGRFRIPSSIQNSTEQQQTNEVNISADSKAIDSFDSNISHGSDVEHKTILNILKRDKRSEKIYERNPYYRVDNNAAYNFERSDKKSAFTAVPAPLSDSFTPTFNNENSFEMRSQQVPRLYPELMPQNNTATGTEEVSQKPDDFLHSSSQEIDPGRIHQYQQVPSNYVQQLERRVQQLSQLYQGSLSHDQLLNQNHASPNMTSYLSMSPQLASYIPHYQQLLLSLNQCYQTMYLQQLEIQQLKQTIQQGFNQDYYGANNVYTRSANYRGYPYNMTSWGNPISSAGIFRPSNLFTDEHDENPKYRSLHAPSRSWPRAVNQQIIDKMTESTEADHKANKVDVSSNNGKQANGETLNNQVPPRTRANNFLDNFRSYSRLNLLSPATNVKRNDTPPLRVNPSSGDETVISNQSDDTYDEAIEIDRPPYCTPLNATVDLQAFMNCATKANAGTAARTTLGQRVRERARRATLPNANPAAEIVFSDRPHVSSRENSNSQNGHSSINVAQTQIQEESKLGNFSSILPSPTDTMSLFPEVTQSEFLTKLYREAQTITNDMDKANALKYICDIIFHAKKENVQNKIRNDCFPSSSVNSPSEDCSELTCKTETGSNIASGSHNSNISNRSSIDYSVPLVSQASCLNSPSKKLSSTGAIRKKPKPQTISLPEETNQPVSCMSNVNHFGNEENISTTHNSDCITNLVNYILHEMTSLFDMWRNSSKDEIVTSEVCTTFNSVVTSKISNLVKMSSKCYSTLFNALEMCTADLHGKRFCECEAPYLRSISVLLLSRLNSLYSNGDIAHIRTNFSKEDTGKTLVFDWNNRPDTDSSSLEINCTPENMPVATEDAAFSVQTVSLPNVSLESNENRNDIQSTGASSNVPDSRSQCRPEGEVEHEVEAGAEADLAEADQSPIQQGNVSASTLVSMATMLEPDSTLINNVPPSTTLPLMNGTDIEISYEVSPFGASCCPDNYFSEEEIDLDDIPTKLPSINRAEPNEDGVSSGDCKDVNFVGNCDLD